MNIEQQPKNRRNIPYEKYLYHLDLKKTLRYVLICLQIMLLKFGIQESPLIQYFKWQGIMTQLLECHYLQMALMS